VDEKGSLLLVGGRQDVIRDLSRPAKQFCSHEVKDEHISMLMINLSREKSVVTKASHSGKVELCRGGAVGEGNMIESTTKKQDREGQKW
jgi:hypothetical protein